MIKETKIGKYVVGMTHRFGDFDEALHKTEARFGLAVGPLAGLATQPSGVGRHLSNAFS